MKLLQKMRSLSAVLLSLLIAGAPVSSFAQSTPGDALSATDDNAVNSWIAERVAANQQPFCYRQSYGRGVGTPLSTCPAGTEKNGLICYPDCKATYGGVGPVCWQGCPSGYVDTGALCHIDKALTTGGSWVCTKKKWGVCWWKSHECPSGYTNAGAFCALNTPSVPSGYKGLTGLDIEKNSYGRGVGTPMDCASGLQEDAALCYKFCNAGYHGVGPVCWQNCPSAMTDCAAGCTSGKTSCASSTANMVIAPLMVVANVAAIVLTAGAAAGATAEVDASVDAGVKGGEAGATEAAQGAKDAAATEKEAGNLAKFQKAIQSKWADFVKSKGTQLKDLKAGDLYKAVTAGSKITAARKFGAAGVAVGMMIDKWVKDAVAGFSSLTTPEVTATLNKQFAGHPQALNWVETQYALVNFSELAGQNGQQSANTALNVAGMVDPTGVSGVVAAYDNPKCSLEDAFPKITIKY
jgi:hypothetical protein